MCFCVWFDKRLPSEKWDDSFSVQKGAGLSKNGYGTEGQRSKEKTPAEVVDLTELRNLVSK